MNNLTVFNFKNSIINGRVTHGYSCLTAIRIMRWPFLLERLIMDKKVFMKQPLTVTEQLELLTKRGLIVPELQNDKKWIEHTLLHNNYYRLEGYWFDKYIPDSYPNHKFKDGITFKDIWNDYCGDSVLRLATFEILSIVEISFRSIFAYTLAKNIGAFPYENNYFNLDIKEYTEMINHLLSDTNHSRDVFINEFKARYSNPLPPI